MSCPENRVYVATYGSLPSDSPLLVPVASAGAQQRLHKLAAAAFEALAHRVKHDLGISLVTSSGWRRHGQVWAGGQPPTRAVYEAYCTRRYGSVAEGQRWVAYESPHETGLAFDLCCGGIEPDRTKLDAMRKTPLAKWLEANAASVGCTPYLVEFPWHWEIRVPLDAYRSGVASTPWPPALPWTPVDLEAPRLAEAPDVVEIVLPDDDPGFLT